MWEALIGGYWVRRGYINCKKRRMASIYAIVSIYKNVFLCMYDVPNAVLILICLRNPFGADLGTGTEVPCFRTEPELRKPFYNYIFGTGTEPF